MWLWKRMSVFIHQIKYSYFGLFFLRGYIRPGFLAISQKCDHLLKRNFYRFIKYCIYRYIYIYLGLTQSNGSKNQRYTLPLSGEI